MAMTFIAGRSPSLSCCHLRCRRCAASTADPLHWRVLLLLGVLGVGSRIAHADQGFVRLTLANGVILNSFAPVMIIALSWLFLRRRLSNVQLAGVMVSLAGVLTILAQGSLAQLLAFRLNLGDIFVIGSMLLWSLYTICLRWRPPGLEAGIPVRHARVGAAAVLPFISARRCWTDRSNGRGKSSSRCSVGLFSLHRIYFLESRRRSGGGERCRPVRASHAGVRHHPRVALLGERRLPRCWYCAHLTGIYVTSRTAVPPVLAPDWVNRLPPRSGSIRDSRRGLAVVWRPYRSSKLRCRPGRHTRRIHPIKQRLDAGFSGRCRFLSGMNVDSLTLMS